MALSGYGAQINVQEYINEYEMTKKFKTNNIVIERVELYKDFIFNLLYYIYDTYLGTEYIKNEYDIRGHYTWCYRKVLKEFEEENIIFIDNEELYDYFYGYFLNQFYNKPEPETLSFYERFWENIFDIKNTTKKRNLFEVLLEMYELFDKSINKKIENPVFE